MLTALQTDNPDEFCRTFTGDTHQLFDFKLLKLRIRKFIEWTEKSHRKFSQKIEVTPNEITITPLDEQFIEKAIKIVEERMSDSDFSVE